MSGLFVTDHMHRRYPAQDLGCLIFAGVIHHTYIRVLLGGRHHLFNCRFFIVGRDDDGVFGRHRLWLGDPVSRSHLVIITAAGDSGDVKFTRREYERARRWARWRKRTHIDF